MKLKPLELQQFYLLPLYTMFLYQGDIGVKVEIESALGQHNWICLASHSKNRVGRLQFCSLTERVTLLDSEWQPIAGTPIDVYDGDHVYREPVIAVSATHKEIKTEHYTFKKTNKWFGYDEGGKNPNLRYEFLKNGASGTYAKTATDS